MQQRTPAADEPQAVACLLCRRTGSGRYLCPECADKAAKEWAQREAEERSKRTSVADALCQEQERRRVRIDREGASVAGVPVTFGGATLRALRIDEHNEAAVDALKKWIDEPRGFLTLTGPVGTGKTYLAAVAVHELFITGAIKASGRAPVFRAVDDLLADIREASHKYDMEPELRRIAQSPMMVLDDIGQAATSDFMRSCLGALVDRRYREGLPTLITTNLTMGEVAQEFDARFASRISPAHLVGGPDRRLQHNRSRVELLHRCGGDADKRPRKCMTA